MTPTDFEATRRRLRADTQRQLVDRLHVCLWIALGAVLLFNVVDVLLRPALLVPLVLAKGILLVVAAGVLLALRHPRAPQWAAPLTLLTIAASEGVTALSGVIAGDRLTTPFLSIGLTVAAAALFPWGVGYQVAAAGCAAVALIGNALLLSPHLAAAFEFPTVAALSALLASVYVAHHLEQQRHAVSERELEHAEDVLLESEQRFRQLAETIQDIFFISDAPFSRILYLSPAFEAITGHPRAAVYANPQLIVDLIHPEDRDATLAAFAGLAQGEFATAEYRLIRADRTHRWVSTRLFPIRDARGEFVRVAGVSQDITERKRAEAVRAGLLAVAADLTGALDLGELLARVHRRIAELLPCDQVITFYWDPARRTQRMIAQYGIPPEVVPAIAALEYRPGDPIAAHLATTGTVVINDVTQQQWVPPELLRRFRVSAVIGSPLVVRGRALGACFAFRTFHAGAFDPGQVQLFEGIARHVGLAIESADLYRAQQEEAGIAAALARISSEMISSLDTPGLLDKLCRLTTEALGCDAAHAFLRETDTDVIVPACSYGDTPEQWETIRLLRIPSALIAGPLANLVRDEVAEITPDTAGVNAAIAQLVEQQGVTRALLVGLRIGETIRGFLGASYRGRTARFTAEQERLARGIGRIASLALENARLVEQLDAANRIRARFVATMSHELRSPIGITMGYADLLLEGTHGPLSPEQADVVRRIRHNAAESLDIIGATLDLSRAEVRRVPLDVEEVAPRDLVEEVVRETAVPTDKPALALEWQVAADVPPLRTDRIKLKMVLKNLLGNAVKFSERGTVVLRVESDANGVRFTVTDTGVGIPDDQLGTIFEPFAQAHGPVSRRHGGAGLGLYIAQRLVEILGGTLAVRSEMDRGSIFSVWLPRAVDPTALAAAGAERRVTRGGSVV